GCALERALIGRALEEPCQVVLERLRQRLGKVRTLRERERGADQHVGHAELSFEQVVVAIEALGDGIGRSEEARTCLARALRVGIAEDRSLDQRRLELRWGKDRPLVGQRSRGRYPASTSGAQPADLQRPRQDSRRRHSGSEVRAPRLTGGQDRVRSAGSCDYGATATAAASSRRSSARRARSRGVESWLIT